MPDAASNAIIAQSIQQSFQDKPVAGTGAYILHWLVRAGLNAYPWWSPARDINLRNFWKTCDQLGGAVYTIQSKMTSIPFQVKARDLSNKDHVAEAEIWTAKLNVGAEWGEGWPAFFGRFVEDLVTQDNGAFAEIIGGGAPSGPLVGAPVTIRHIDAARCLGRDTRILMATGETVSILDVVRKKMVGPVVTIDSDGKPKIKPITGWYETPLGDRYWLQVGLRNARHVFGRKEKLWVTNDHEIMTRAGWKRADSLSLKDEVCTEYPSPNFQQRQLLCGALLGDGFISRGKRLSVFGLTQGIKQRDWLWLKRLALDGFEWGPIRQNKNTVQTETHISPAFSELRELWYPNGKKRVPREFVERNFSSLMLATWYADDGNKMNGEYGRPKARFYTNSLPQDDVEWLADLLTRNGIKAWAKSLVNTTGKREYFIYVCSDGAEKLFEMVAPYLPPCLRYKVPEDSKPFNPDLWELGLADRHYDQIEVIDRKPNGTQVTAFCIDVPDTHNFIGAGMVVHNCQRTGDPIYPIIYHDLNGKMYKVHSSRVFYASQMASPIREMYGVGFSAISRAINTAQNLVDVLIYKQEKIGSRPRRGILVAKGGLDPEDVAEAFRLVDSEQDAQGLSRYSKIALVGDSSLPEAGLELTDLASLPDGFDEETSFNLGIAVIALAFGLDARELAPAMASGATRADALLQHLKQRGKGPGQIIQLTESLFNFKVLPPYLQLVFDFQDDEQDRQAAETKEIRSRRWNTAITSGALSVRTAREQMMEVGDLERAQFEELELEDGRLPDGASVLALFYSKDSKVKKLLDLGLGADFDPFAVDINAPETILPAIRTQMGKAQAVIVNGTNQEERWRGMQAVAALKELEKQYRTPSPEEQAQAQAQPGQPGQPKQPKPSTLGMPPTQTEHDNRVRKVSLQSPNRTGIKPDEKLEPNSDETVKEAGIEAAFPF